MEEVRVKETIKKSWNLKKKNSNDVETFKTILNNRHHNKKKVTDMSEYIQYKKNLAIFQGK